MLLLPEEGAVVLQGDVEERPELVGGGGGGGDGDGGEEER